MSRAQPSAPTPDFTAVGHLRNYSYIWIYKYKRTARLTLRQQGRTIKHYRNSQIPTNHEEPHLHAPPVGIHCRHGCGRYARLMRHGKGPREPSQRHIYHGRRPRLCRHHTIRTAAHRDAKHRTLGGTGHASYAVLCRVYGLGAVTRLAHDGPAYGPHIRTRQLRDRPRRTMPHACGDLYARHALQQCGLRHRGLRQVGSRIPGIGISTFEGWVRPLLRLQLPAYGTYLLSRPPVG